MKHKYHLKTGSAGEQQLDYLDQMFGESSRKFLTTINLKEGMQVADIGCGIGNLSFWMAQQVTKTGHVFAIDNSAEQLEIAKQRAQQQQLKNISFHLMDAHNLSKFNDAFDLCFCRWLLMHVKDPMEVVKSMANTVKLNGLLAFEVGDLRANDFYPSFPSFEFFIEKLLALSRKLGRDMNICYRIFQIASSLNNFSTHIQFSQPIITDPEILANFSDLVCVLIDSSSSSFIENDILTHDELSKLKIDILKHTITPHSIAALSRMTQVWCKKKI